MTAGGRALREEESEDVDERKGREGLGRACARDEGVSGREQEAKRRPADARRLQSRQRRQQFHFDCSLASSRFHSHTPRALARSQPPATQASTARPAPRPPQRPLRSFDSAARRPRGSRAAPFSFSAPHERALHLRPPTCRPCESPRPPPPAHHALTPPTAATSSPFTPRLSSARMSSSRATSPLVLVRLRATFLQIRSLARSCDHSHTWPMQAPSSTQRQPSLPSQGPS